jgi:hypothetical protein
MLHVGPICCTWAAGAQLSARALLLAGQLPEPTSGCCLYHLNGKPNFLEPSPLSTVESGEQGRFRVPRLIRPVPESEFCSRVFPLSKKKSNKVKK